MLTVHRGSRADLLITRLGQVLATPTTDDPLAPEIVAVHSRGVERWIAQQLSHKLGAGPVGDGIAANIEFPFPATIVERAVQAGLGELGDGQPAMADPWRAGSLTFTLLDVLHRDEISLDELDAFGHHISGSAHRRLPAMRHAAELLDSYQQHRPDMVLAWTHWDGEEAAPDGSGSTLPARMTWQARLLVAARERIGETRAERMARAVKALAAGNGPVAGLPQRLSLFALTAVAEAHFRVLDALASRIDVHTFVLHPSPVAWDRGRTAAVAAVGQRPQRTQTVGDRSGHPLLFGWGRDSRELQVLLGGQGHDDPLDAKTAAPTTLLERMQRDIRDDAAIADDDHAPWALTSDDRSVQVHSAHGRQRQVEVARDAILTAMVANPDLEPRDIVVMTPDVETFAPLVDASFRAAATKDSGIPDLRVRLADRSLVTANPLTAAIAHLLDLADSRMEAGTVLEFLQRAPVRARFGLDDDDVEDVDRWITDSGIKWGLDLEHRQRLDLPGDNTWQFGLDRVMAGVVMADGRLGDSVLAIDGTTVDVAMVGAVAEFVARLDHVTSRMRDVADHHGHPAHAWVEMLREAADLLTATDHDDAWQRWQFDQLLNDVGTRSDGSTATISLRELRGLLASQLGGRPTRANHQTGDLTVCSLVPMRTVPFRVVVVIGLDDGAFPRNQTRSGDDILGLHALVGDRDPASEDRQLLLDALMAACDQFIVTYRGANESTNQEVPPSVVVAELLDAIADTVGWDSLSEKPHPVREQHPLRAADPRTFDGHHPGFDLIALAGAQALADGPATEQPIAFDPPSAVDVRPVPTSMSIGELSRILSGPAKAYMRHVFGFTDKSWEDSRDDNLMVEAKGLDGWRLGHELLDSFMTGSDTEQATSRLLDAGALPVGRLAGSALDEHRPLAATIAKVALDCIEATRTADVDHEDIVIELMLDGISLGGTVTPTVPGLMVATSYSSFKPGHLIQSWVAVLAAAATGSPIRTVLITKPTSRAQKREVSSYEFEAPDQAEAVALLTDLVRVANQALVHPIPLFANTSGAYWLAAHAGEDEGARITKAGKMWLSGFPDQYGEGTDPNIVHLFGNGSLPTLLNAGQVTLTDAPAWWNDSDMPHELARWARRVYEPMWAAVIEEEHRMRNDETAVTT